MGLAEMKNLLELNHPQINVSKLVLLRGLCIQTLMVLQYQKMVLSAVIVSERWHREIHRSFLKAVFWKYKDILDFTKKWRCNNNGINKYIFNYSPLMVCLLLSGLNTIFLCPDWFSNRNDVTSGKVNVRLDISQNYSLWKKSGHQEFV